MTKPIYTYRKGVGWYVTPDYNTVLHDGMKVKLEIREPSLNERYLVQWTDYVRYYRDGAPFMDNFIADAKSYRYSQLRIFKGVIEGPVVNEHGITAYPVYVTVVPVETP